MVIVKTAYFALAKIIEIKIVQITVASVIEKFDDELCDLSRRNNI